MKFKLFLFTFLTPFFLLNNAFAVDLNSAAYSLNSEKRGMENLDEIQKIEALLNNFEASWNEHNIEKVYGFYSDTFVNGDGLTLDQVKSLTEELWQAYPDVKTSTQQRDIRVYGDYATVMSTDLYEGASRMLRDDVGSRGTLKALSVGELYLKKFGSKWKITSDKTSFERVGIGYGIGSELIDSDQIKLSAPEQVYSNNNYTATLEFNMPREYKAVASIGKELLVYPQQSTQDKFRLVDENVLERLFNANNISKNELISATVGITGGVFEPKLLGLIFITRRVNVIPVNAQRNEIKVVTEKASASLGNSTNDYFYPDYTRNEESPTSNAGHSLEFNFNQ